MGMVANYKLLKIRCKLTSYSLFPIPYSLLPITYYRPQCVPHVTEKGLYILYCFQI
jgi:hypothetical protein